MKIIKRSKLRIAIGRVYYNLKRQIDWRFSGKRFARVRNDTCIFPIVLYQHQSPLFRDLPKVDLRLQENKVINLQIGIKALNNLIINPGEVFSFWLQLGKPSKSKGYVDGFVLKDGCVEAGIGGGLCQLSNLIYWMTIHTPLTVLERWRHSYDVFPDANRTVPFGGGATCSYPSLDLQIKNTTSHPVQLCVRLCDNYLIGEWRGLDHFQYSYRVYESFHEIISDFRGRYVRHNILRRKVFNADLRQIEDQFVIENYGLMMYQPLLDTQKGVKEAK